MIAPLMPTYGERDIAFTKGEGPYLHTEDGRRFLDFGGGIAVTSLGHAHPHLVAALKDQAERLWHTSNLYNIPNQERAGRRLTENSFADTVFFCNSGLEAVEAGIKLVRKHYADKGETDRYRIITLEGCFHGRSLASISASGQEKLIKGFGPVVDGFDQVPFGNTNALRAAVDGRTCAVLVEPVQGEGGIRSMDEDYLRAVRAVCDEFGLLMFLDEVQCGMGRTGKLFAYEWAGIEPDVMALAKGLGGGFPVGACLATETAASGMVAGTHGSTFGGNPLATAAVNAVLDVILEDGFLDNVRSQAANLKGRLETLGLPTPDRRRGGPGQGIDGGPARQARERHGRGEIARARPARRSGGRERRPAPAAPQRRGGADRRGRRRGRGRLQGPRTGGVDRHGPAPTLPRPQGCRRSGAPRHP